MTRRGPVVLAATLSVFACFLALSAHGQTRPNPPPQICVNGQCASTPVTTPPSGTSSGKIKWNPGHYMASYTVLFGGRSPSFIQAETDDLNNQDAIVGYRMLVTWAALEPTEGNYDFSAIDATLQRLKTAYNKPKHLVIMLWTYGQHPYSSNGDTRVIPSYIQQDPKYGASPVSGSYGWWGQRASVSSNGTYAPALYYPPVNDRLIALVQAMGQHLDNDPNVEALFFQENSTIVAAANTAPKDPHYNDNAYLAQTQRLLSAATAAFPHTSVIMGNSWLYEQPATVALQQWMLTHRIATGSADSFGQSSIDAKGTRILSWSLRSYIGDPGFGGVDMRPTMTAMMDVESGDINDSFQGDGGPWTAPDIIQAMNKTYHASHVFWTRLTGSGTRPEALWPTVAAACAATPILRTGYPANYP